MDSRFPDAEHTNCHGTWGTSTRVLQKAVRSLPFLSREREASGTVIKAISPGRETLFLRYDGKFDSGFDVSGFQSYRRHNVRQLLLCRREGGRLQPVFCQLRSGPRRDQYCESWKNLESTSIIRINVISGETTSFPLA